MLLEEREAELELQAETELLLDLVLLEVLEVVEELLVFIKREAQD